MPDKTSSPGDVSQNNNFEKIEKIAHEELEEAKKSMEYLISMRQFTGPMPPQIFDKITPEHITSIIEQQGQLDERNFSLAKTARGWNFVNAILAMTFFGGLFIFLTLFLGAKDIEAYKSILQDFFLFAAGFSGGFGLKAAFSKRNKD